MLVVAKDLLALGQVFVEPVALFTSEIARQNTFVQCHGFLLCSGWQFVLYIVKSLVVKYKSSNVVPRCQQKNVQD